MELLSEERLVVHLDEVDSTNNYLHSLVRKQKPEEGSVVIAEFQLGGRGQMGNGWFSEKGKNLLFSLLIYPDNVEANAQFIISRIASLAVKNTLDQFTDDIRIKWPNDIYWKDKKIAGILNQDHFPEELPNPVSLKQVTGSEFDRDYILDNFVREFFLIYREFQNGNEKAIEDEYMLDLYRINDYYWFEDDNGRFKAIIKEVLPSGHLVLKTLETAEERVYAFKEVSFVD